MIFKPFYRYETGCAGYLLGCGTLGKCAVIDPREGEIDMYMKFAESKSMRITHVLETHVHADHRSSGRQLAHRTGAAYCLHRSAEVDFRLSRWMTDRRSSWAIHASASCTPRGIPRRACVTS